MTKVCVEPKGSKRSRAIAAALNVVVALLDGKHEVDAYTARIAEDPHGKQFLLIEATLPSKKRTKP